jgi:hypothetical protein
VVDVAALDVPTIEANGGGDMRVGASCTRAEMATVAEFFITWSLTKDIIIGPDSHWLLNNIRHRTVPSSGNGTMASYALFTVDMFYFVPFAFSPSLKAMMSFPYRCSCAP